MTHITHMKEAIPQDLQPRLKRIKGFIALGVYGEHERCDLGTERAYIERIAKSEQEIAAIKRGPCCRDPWCGGECTCEICAPQLAIRELKIENEQWRT